MWRVLPTDAASGTLDRTASVEEVPLQTSCAPTGRPRR
jgi:hypothetical protein